jgi:hypothetical protein
MSNGLLAFATGLAGGYTQAKQRAEEQARIDEDRTMRGQLHDAQMDEINQAKDLRISLSNAASPLKVTEVTDVDPSNPEAPRKTSFTLADGRTVATREEADKAAKEWDAPGAQTARIANVYRSKGAVDKAITLENSAVDRKRADEKYTQEQTDRANKLHQEGVFDAVRAFRAGDASGLVKAFNAGGEYKLDGEPVITKEERDIPGIGKVPTYSAKLRIIGPDGQIQEKAYNSHDLSMTLLPYEKALEFQGKLSKDAADTTYKAGMLGAAQKTADAAMIRAQRAGGDGGGSGGTKAPSGYRFAADGKTLEAIPGGPADKTGASSKPLSGSVVKQLQEVGDNAVTLANLSNTFKDNFANKGILGAGADSQLSLSATLGKDKDSVDWWKNYRKQAELVERHASFGASLTPGEQESWRSADIGPGMHPDVIKRNLQTRANLAARMLENSRQDAIDAGHSEDRVNAIAGRRNTGGATTIPMPAQKSALKAGTIYQTSRGPAKWNGTAFEAQ